MNKGAIIVGLIALILVIWWLMSLQQISIPRSKKNVPVSFFDMIASFKSYPSCLWMSCSIRDFNDALKESPFHYTIIESDGTVFYDNRGKKHDKNIIDWFEVTMAVSNGDGWLVRDGKRQLAIRVCNDLPSYRVVHISSPMTINH